jgi:hypothetical protein
LRFFIAVPAIAAWLIVLPWRLIETANHAASLEIVAGPDPAATLGKLSPTIARPGNAAT